MKNLLTEYFELSPDGICLDLLTEREKQEVAMGGKYLTGILQAADKKNGNGRKYPYETLKREVDSYLMVVKDRRACGELDHPDDSVINLKNVSHMVTEIWWDKKNVMGKIKILDTPSGRTVKDLINAGVKLGISSRGMGSVKEMMGETIVEDDFKLICFDIVSEPSTPNAYVYTDDNSGGVYRARVAENKQNIINNLFKKILKG